MVSMILVTGATGTIGSEVVRQLAARGEMVRALTRDPAAARTPAGVEAVPGHHRDRASVEAAMAGADAAFLVGVFGPDDGRYDRGLVEAARAAGVRRIVKLSSIGTGDPRLGVFGTWHLPGEEAVRASGLEWTILRASSFASNTLSWAQAVREGTPVPSMMSDGEQGVVDPRDVSGTAVAALLDGRLAGRTYTLTGPEAISASRQAAVLGEVVGRPVRLYEPTPEERRAGLLAAGLGEAYADSLVVAARFIEEGGNAVVTDDVRETLGRPPRTFRDWAEDHRQAFA
ncbi:NAD(P)H-binding protein [Streptomyces sp. NPDC020996]|uniref:NAD(P)H-binding protein n=1 Tax=Streptomyces sp. NPDC020996 TaxID=3154791 RepID=UPI0033D53F9E